MIQPMFALLPTQNEYLEASKLKDKFTPKCKKISHYLLKLVESPVQVFFLSPGIIYGASQGKTVLQDSPEQLK